MKKIFNKFGNKVRIDSIPVGECFMAVFDDSVFMMSNQHNFSTRTGEEKVGAINLTTGHFIYFKKDFFVIPIDVEIIVGEGGKEND